MPRIRRPDGVEIEWFEQGSGPLVVLGGYWSLVPSVFDGITEELVREHRVVRYDDRGTGASTRKGPYDLETAADDLAAVIEAAGGRAIVVCIADGANRAVRVCARHPELIEAIVGVGAAPLGREAFAGMDVMAASEGVVDALRAQIETDYRGLLRGVLATTNPQMSEEELRERIDAQVAHVPQNVASERMGSWADDRPLEYAKAAGDRLYVLIAEKMTGGWFPAGKQLEEVLARELPEAHTAAISDGLVSRPDETAAVVRSISTRATAGQTASRAAS